jgi:hypothetical protein
MRLFPAHFGDLRRDDDAAPGPQAKDESREEVFRLIPPRAEAFTPPGAAKLGRPAGLEQTGQSKPSELEQARKPSEPEQVPSPAETEEPRSPVHEVAALSIEDEGTLSWGGKPLEVRWRLVLSGGQVVAATLLGLLLIVSAFGAVVQGSATAHSWACRLGWTAVQCMPAPDFPT